MTYEKYNCDLCGSDESVEVPNCRLYTYDQQPINICKKCGFVYVPNRRSPEAVADAWSNEVYGDGYTARIPAVLARQTYVADYTDLTIGLSGKRLLDIGGGEGQFLEIASKQYGALPFAVEPSEANCASLLKNGFDCFHGTIEQFAQSGAKHEADVATIMWTMENCVSCRDMLSIAYEQIKEGGHLVIATGSRLLVPFKKTLKDYLGYHPADLHSFRFSANTLRGLMAVSGFKPIHINRYLDTDYLVVVGEKLPAGEEIPWEGDNYLAVHNFFDRWHKESTYYI